MKRLRYAVIGTGHRASMFIDPIVSRFQETSELVGLCDSNPHRATYHQKRLSSEYGTANIPVFSDFDEMLQRQKPDVIIVCTPDACHHDYIIRSLDADLDVISEKPITTDARKCQSIFDAVKRSGRKVRTTFNMRWAPGVTKVKELIALGTIGRIKHIDFEYRLNTSHGADYFRRWHSEKEISGGLLVHKSTHHFDVINWWLNAIPATVFAMGDLVFYGKNNALARGDGSFTRYNRYTEQPESIGDPFRLALDDDPKLRGLYYEAEKKDGYIRDRNVFREGITIEDSMSVLIKYRTGEMASYSLNAYSPTEGFRAAISGDRGLIEYEERRASHILESDGTPHCSPETTMKLTVQNLFSVPYDVPIQKGEGGHGGADVLIQEQIFSDHPPQDTLRRNAGHEQGAASMLVGDAGNISIAKGQPVAIDDLLQMAPQAKHLHELI